ncbi:MAG: hypothetical protein J1E98_00670 [Lachnospiraceae bacterium]|nr:hypothetical protein [Lachnospiraceae bacterium]
MSLFSIATDVLQEKIKVFLSEHYQEWLNKKKIEEILDDLCVRQEGQALFDNQGFAEGIDFYVLTNTLRAELIDNVSFYYSEADRKKAGEIKDRFYERVQAQTGAVTAEQKKAVSHFLDRIYKMTRSYMQECLNKEDLLVAIIGNEYTDQQIDIIREELFKLFDILKNQSDAEAWKWPVDEFRVYHQRQKDSNGVYGLLNISDRLFPALSAWGGVQYLNENGDSVPLYTCLSKGWESPERNHLLLMGGGGMGKTVSLLRLWDKLLEDGICTIYIPLHEIMGVVTTDRLTEDVIKKFLTDNVWHGNAQKMGKFLDHLSEYTDKPMLILLLDGFNEIPSGNRRVAMPAIKKWMVYSGVQVVISSRYDFRQDLTAKALSELKIEPLSDEQVEAWFKLCEMPVPDKNEKVYNLLKTPFMLTLYTQVENRYNQGKDAKFVKWVEHADTSSDLMWNFMQCQILKMANDHLKPDEDILKAVVASTYILPYICWVMEWKELFAVKTGELKQWIKEASQLYKNKWKTYPDPWVEFLENKFGSIRWRNNDFRQILTEELNLLVNRDDETYSLLHQNFRDFLAAVHLYHIVEVNIEKAIAETWEKRPFSDNVVNFLAEWMPEKVADAMFQSLRGKQISEGNYIFFNLMRVIRKIKQDDLSGMDFSDMDLRTVVLNGARLVNGEQRAVFRNARINYGTLVMQGHHDKVYFVTFSEDGRQLLSVSAFEIRIWDLTTGSCVHEIVEGPYKPGGYFEYNQPEYQKKFVMADGREFIWIGENETCAQKYIDIFKYLLQCSDGWKEKATNPYVNPNHLEYNKESLERLFKHKKDSKMIEIQEDAIIVSLPTGEKRMLTGNQAMATCANLSKDLKYCVAGLEDGGICIWDLETGRLTRELSKSTHQICYVDGDRTLFIGQTTGIVMIWECDNEEYKTCHYMLEGRKTSVTAVSLAGDICIVSHEDDVAEIWKVSENRIIKTLEHCQYLTITDDENFICAQTSEGDVWYYNRETKEKKVLWTGVDRTQAVLCYGKRIYKWSDIHWGYALAMFNPDDEQFRPTYNEVRNGYRDAPNITCRHNWVMVTRRYLPAPYGIYTIINLNLFGCDFTGAVFETLELAAKVKSNGGILKLPEEYHTRLLPEWARTTPAWLRTPDSD